MKIDNGNTQLTSIESYNPTERMIFSPVISEEIPDSRPKIEYKRIIISTRNEDGTIGDLIIQTERLYSFGVSQTTSQETGKITGYTFPLCMWSRDGPTDEEKKWTDTFNAIVDCCANHLVENREEIERFELVLGELNKTRGGLNPMYWKMEKYKDETTGKTVLRRVPDRGPTLYTKLIFSKKNNKFLTQFFDENDEPIDALDLMGKHCYAVGAIKIESIYIGAKTIALQVKLYEVVVEPTRTGMKRLLARPTARPKVLTANPTNSSAATAMEDEDDDDDAGSLVGSDDEETVTPVPSTETTKKLGRIKNKETGQVSSSRNIKRVTKKTV